MTSPAGNREGTCVLGTVCSPSWARRRQLVRGCPSPPRWRPEGKRIRRVAPWVRAWRGTTRRIRVRRSGRASGVPALPRSPCQGGATERDKLNRTKSSERDIKPCSEPYPNGELRPRKEAEFDSPRGHLWHKKTCTPFGSARLSLVEPKAK